MNFDPVNSFNTNRTHPALVWPGTAEAYERGCTCPVEENMNRLKLGGHPLLSTTCRVHSKICSAEDCGHGSHLGPHFRCEHCTNILHICVICEAVYMDDGFDPRDNGWVFVESDPIVKGWRCKRCRA